MNKTTEQIKSGIRSPQPNHHRHHQRHQFHPSRPYNLPGPRPRHIIQRRRPIDILERDIARVKAIIPRHLRDIFRLCECNIDTLSRQRPPHQRQVAKRDIHYTKQPHAAPPTPPESSHYRQHSPYVPPAAAPAANKSSPGTAGYWVPRRQTA